MKTLFIPAYRKLKQNKAKILEISKQLPKNIAIAYSIQYKYLANEIKSSLEDKHSITSFIQVLGCTKPKFAEKTQAILLIIDGKFHRLSLALQTKLPIYILENNKLNKISNEEIIKFQKKQKVAYLNFLNAEKVGILVSIKPGQENLKKALNLQNKLKNKSSYLFLADNINIAEFENFPDIGSWVNTACPRLEFDSEKIVNTEKIK